VRYRLAAPPASIVVDGIRVDLGSWATPAIRRGLYAGWYEEPERRIMKATLRADDRYMELGAGTGLVTALACGIVGDQRVTAYEADPAMARVARQTLRLNGFAPEIHTVVLGGFDGETDFYVHPDFWASSLTPSPGARKLRAHVRSFRAELERFRPSYLMVDVEGDETHLLSSPLPDYVRRLCVESHPEIVGDTVVRSLLDTLRASGWTIDLHDRHDSVAFLSRSR
jgi:FkbM family methyltransferase